MGQSRIYFLVAFLYATLGFSIGGHPFFFLVTVAFNVFVVASPNLV
jgi:hypothetical protein